MYAPVLLYEYRIHNDINYFVMAMKLFRSWNKWKRKYEKEEKERYFATVWGSEVWRFFLIFTSVSSVSYSRSMHLICFSCLSLIYIRYTCISCFYLSCSTHTLDANTQCRVLTSRCVFSFICHSDNNSVDNGACTEKNPSTVIKKKGQRTHLLATIWIHSINVSNSNDIKTEVISFTQSPPFANET